MPASVTRRKTRNRNDEVKITPLLREFIDEYAPSYEELPREWKDIDIEGFSKEKRLWDFQVEAIEFAIRALYYYYAVKDADKLSFWEEFKDYCLERYDLDVDELLSIKVSDSEIFSILSSFFYSVEDRISFGNFCNRMGFWMATGSGKTLLIVKLIDILATYMERGLMPKKDILFLTYRDDLIEQFERHFTEYKFSTGKTPKLFELKDFGKAKELNDFLVFPVFYYRSNNIKDRQGDKTLDFKDYDNHGNWYIILDEAHKGDKESSKSQQYFSILSRNGFLFNFSATFTDIRDILMTVYEFNLSSYIREGYGKVLRIFDENIKLSAKISKDSKDFTIEEKEIIFLKILILLAYLKKKSRELRSNEELMVEYHSPLAVFLGNSVNVEDSDVKLIFERLRFLSSIEGFENYLNGKPFLEAKESLINSIPNHPFDDEEDPRFNKNELSEVTPGDVLREVFNAEAPGEIEMITSTSGKEFAIKLMTSDKPFALVKVGEAKKLVDTLVQEFGLRIQERFENTEYFATLDEHEYINILIGSRAFYEGWDSNRPNVIVFVNIGTGEDAKKFVLQSIGRGLRIQPTKNGDRKRLEMDKKFRRYINIIKPIETLYVWGTKKDVIQKILEGVKTLKESSGTEVRLYKNERRIANNRVFIPVFVKVPTDLDFDAIQRFHPIQISESDYIDARNVVMNMSDEMLYFMFFLKSKSAAKKIELLREIFDEANKIRFFIIERNTNKHIGWYNTIRTVVKAIEREFGYKYELTLSSEDEEYIQHYKRIVIRLPEKKVERVSESIKEVYFGPKRQSFVPVVMEDSMDLLIRFIQEHYYIPVLEALNREALAGKILDIIKERSEINFIDDLMSVSDRFEVDWWLFSKIVEKKDKVFVPYRTKEGEEAYFYPDFIFWFRKGSKYLVVFVDPKGTEHTDAERKIDGFEELFVENSVPKKFKAEGYEVKVKLYLYKSDQNIETPRKYADYWLNSIDDLVNRVNQEFQSNW
ncbi:Type III restriction enzyme, res subunit [Fervidobacterium changbaicum]|uniref:DEAD/DEAH box helicase family protein n=2 Tax=Fervidobacterium TaxID=2422 RepID=A0AAI8CL84_FERIS|nr:MULTISPECIES: DEAD/DEAH box helicase family protein [Fervidobacterium]AMW32396.1 DEAD/DEAH box helicase family protein [Fervidobacterium islandicum]QAV34023.1 restriction endonuclease subunit R [Fervidobacterium changbaicum]SDH37515.1 Type III restriction enzyme, res subunit [Fervidobacterium changbaicum]